MHGHSPQFMFGLGPDHTLCAMSWQTTTSVGALAKTTNVFRFGQGWSGVPAVTYAATGVYTVTFPSGMIAPTQPIIAVAFPQWDVITNWFDCAVVGETTLTTTARQVVINCARDGTANAPGSNAGSRINLVVLIQNNTGG